MKETAAPPPSSRVPASHLDLTAVQIPWHFRCPISLELMRDPVTVSTGQTYDRSSIESWIATGNTTCPVTRSPLADSSFIPNHNLRRLIQEWCVAHSRDGVERIPTPKQPADPTLVRRLAAVASDVAAGAPARIAALRRLRSAARESERDRTVVAAAASGAIASIAFTDSDNNVAVEALSVLAILPMSESEARSAADRGIGRLAEWISSEENSPEVRSSAAAVVETVAAATAGDFAVGAADNLIEGLVSLVHHRESSRSRRAAVRALFALCLSRSNRARAVAAGAAAAVMGKVEEMMAVGEGERALAAVELLCRGEGGREAVAAAAEAGGGEGVRVLVGAMAGGRGGRAAEYAAGALTGVVIGSEELQKEAVAAGAVEELLVMVQGGCSERGRRKAQMLLKMLTPAWAATHNAAANSDEFLQQF